jgi:hypothetical protein
LLDGTRVYLHAVIDNFSRRILAWRVAEMFAPVTSVIVLLEAGRGATPSETTPVVLADAGVENVTKATAASTRLAFAIAPAMWRLCVANSQSCCKMSKQMRTAVIQPGPNPNPH